MRISIYAGGRRNTMFCVYTLVLCTLRICPLSLYFIFFLTEAALLDFIKKSVPSALPFCFCSRTYIYAPDISCAVYEIYPCGLILRQFFFFAHYFCPLLCIYQRSLSVLCIINYKIAACAYVSGTAASYILYIIYFFFLVRRKEKKK